MTNVPVIGATVGFQTSNVQLLNNNNNISTTTTSAAFKTTNISTAAPQMDQNLNFSRISVTSTPKKASSELELDVTNSLELGATALFNNSDVDLDDVCLNEQVTNMNPNAVTQEVYQDEELARSEPDLMQLSDGGGVEISAKALQERSKRLTKRTHKRSESEPFMGIQSLNEKPTVPGSNGNST